MRVFYMQMAKGLGTMRNLITLLVATMAMWNSPKIVFVVSICFTQMGKGGTVEFFKKSVCTSVCLCLSFAHRCAKV